jgi:hypothetical protein
MRAYGNDSEIYGFKGVRSCWMWNRKYRFSVNKDKKSQKRRVLSDYYISKSMKRIAKHSYRHKQKLYIKQCLLEDITNTY